MEALDYGTCQDTHGHCRKTGEERLDKKP